MKIAVFHHLPSGGALRALREKILIFRKLGHSVRVFTFSTAECEMFPLDSGELLTVEPLQFSGPGRFGNYSRASRSLAKKINASDADKVWVEKCRFFGSPPLLQFLKKPSIFYMQEPLRIRAYEALAPVDRESARFSGPALKLADWAHKLSEAPAHFFIKAQDKKSAHAAGTVYANSRYCAAWIARVYGIKAQPFYQGVDTDFFKPIAGVVSKNQLLSVGRINASKAHDFSLRAIAGVSKKIRPSFVIACDAVDERILHGLETEASSIGVNLEIRQRISDEALRALYNESRLVLCSARHEPFGLVPLEASACGVPVLAVDEGGFRETVLHGCTGYLMPRDEIQWSRCIEEFLADETSRRRLGETARSDAIDRWQWDTLLPQYEKSLKT